MEFSKHKRRRNVSEEDSNRRDLRETRPLTYSYNGKISDIKDDHPEGFRRRTKKKKRGISKIFKVLGIALVLIAGFLIIRVIFASLGIVDRSGNIRALALRDSFELTELKGEGDGRVNILLIGVGGNNHDGGALSDVNLVVSIDPLSNDVDMLSIPRDMYVEIPGYYSAKINEAHSIGEDSGKGNGPKLAVKTVENFLGVPIHYFVRTDFTGFEQAIDAVGGIDIDVKESLYDPAFPDKRMDGYEPFQISAGKHHMNGELALKYARCRKGNCGDDYGRAQRQQQVLLALKEKALSAGTLSNPFKVNSLISAVGDHVKTDLNLREIGKLVSIAEKVDTTKMETHVLGRDDAESLTTSMFIGSADSIVPTLGIGNYSDIQAYARKLFVDGFIRNENAKVVVLNGTSTPGLATSAGDLLKSYGYNVVNVGDHAETSSDNSLYLNKSDRKVEKTTTYLERRFRTKAVESKDIFSEYPEADLVIVLGTDYNNQ